MVDLIVDSNSLYARSYYAAQKLGEPEAALRIASITLLNLLNPLTNSFGTTINRTLFCWDSGHNEAKHREPKPPGYHELRGIAKEVFTLLIGAVHAEIEPYEGDDLVASAVYSSKPKTDVIVASGDKDLMQLVDTTKGIVYYSFNDKCALSDAFVCNKFFVKKPYQVALALAIQGDSADHIPGVVGWGKEKVKKLFKAVTKEMAFDDVLGILENSMNAEQRQQFYESLNRTMLTTNIPMPMPAPLVFADEDNVAALGMPEVSHKMRELSCAYDMAYGNDMQ